MCGSILNDLSVRDVFLVTGKNSYIQSGAKDYLDDVLSNCTVSVFDEFEPNPKLEDLRRGIDLFRRVKSDLVVAVGGGSVIDMAKLINFFGANDIDPAEYIEDNGRKVRRGRYLIAAPTTAGSGSEATHFAVLYICHRKYSVAHRCIMPDFSVVDPSLTMSLPARQTAISGMDALCQAVESYWSVNSTELSKWYARRSIQLVVSNLTEAVNRPNEAARTAMAKAAHLAGKAINITKTSAPHSISYPLTTYFGIPHGHAVALTLPSIMVYNYNVNDDVLDRRGGNYVKKAIIEITNLLGAENVCEAKQLIEALMNNIGLETRLSSLGVSSVQGLEKIVEDGFALDRVNNNPRKLTPLALRQILQSIY